MAYRMAPVLVILSYLEGHSRLQAFSSAICLTFVRYFTRFILTARLRGPSAIAGFLVLLRLLLISANSCRLNSQRSSTVCRVGSRGACESSISTGTRIQRWVQRRGPDWEAPVVVRSQKVLSADERQPNKDAACQSLKLVRSAPSLY